MTASPDDRPFLYETDSTHRQEIERNLRALDSRDPHTRAGAVKRLGQLKANTELILPVLDDPNPSVRAEAAAALGMMRIEEVTPEVEDRLMAAIDDPSDRVCSAALYSLGRLGIQSSRSQVEACLDDSSPYVQSAAVLALARLGARDLSDRLAELLDHDEIRVQIAAIRAITLLEHRPAGQRLLRHVEANLDLDRQGKNGDMMANAVIGLGVLQVREAIPLLMRIAQTEVGLRGKAVQALMALQAEQAAPVLAKMLAEPSGRLREALVLMMVEANYTPALPLIRPLLKEQSGYLRDAALQAVMKLGDTASAKTVRWMCFHEPQPFTRLRALECLVSLVGRGAIPDLVALKADLNTEVRRAVVHHLGDWEELPPEALAALETMAARDPDPEISRLARQALSRLPAAVSQVSPTPAPIPILPDAVLSQVSSLLSALESWQAGLPELALSQSAEEIAATDRALTYLIRRLEAANQHRSH